MEMTPEQLHEKWEPIIEAKDVDPIVDPYRKKVISKLLENQEVAIAEQRLQEAVPGNSTANVANWDPVLISLVRRTMPVNIGFDLFGVQPMSGPTGLIFSLTSHYDTKDGDEALFNEAKTDQSMPDATKDIHGDAGGVPAVAGTDPFSINYGTGQSVATATVEDAATNPMAEMAIKIVKKSVTAGSRGLKAAYTVEMAQDMKAIHGLDADSELANLLSSEVIAEQNREMIRRTYLMAKVGVAGSRTIVDATVCSDCAVQGVFNLDVDSNGRWSVERFKGLMFQIEREANAIAIKTRRGKGNYIIVSADVASALAMTGLLEANPTSLTPGIVMPATQAYVGMLNGRTKVYIDPFITVNMVLVGYKGANPYDAGAFYCPYVPFTLYRTVGEDDFQPRMGLKTRYGFTQHPYQAVDGADDAISSNEYFRMFRVDNLI